MQMIRPLSWEFSLSRSELVSGNLLCYKGILQEVPSFGHVEDTSRLSEKTSGEDDECLLPLIGEISAID